MPTPISNDPLARLAERQRWITPGVQQAVQDWIKIAFSGLDDPEKVRGMLHGDWLHEPLHAVLTDIPVGSWTAAVVFDTLAAITGSEALDHAADASVVLGTLGAVGAAITGLNDWADIKAEAPKRIGATHALLNTLALGLFTWSAVARRKPDTRTKARSLAALGSVVASASAHLGGTMIYEHGIGVEAGKPWAEAVSPR